MKLLLLDVDHTVSCANWRDFLLGRWDEYHALSHRDNPIEAVIALVQSMHKDEWTVVGLTARPHKWRKTTVDWLVKHNVPYDVLIMRPDDDYEKTPELKVRLYQEFIGQCGPADDDVVVVLDDREDVAAAFHAIGVTALQVNAKGKRPAPVSSEKEYEHEG